MNAEAVSLAGLLDIIGDRKMLLLRVQELQAEIDELKSQRAANNVVVMDKTPVDTPNG